jgi:hypothetical protein
VNQQNAIIHQLTRELEEAKRQESSFATDHQADDESSKNTQSHLTVYIECKRDEEEDSM